MLTHPGIMAATMDIIHIIIMVMADIGATIQLRIINIEQAKDIELEIMMG